MGYYNFLGVLEIIKGSIQILPKNGKIMASIATLGLLLYSSTFLGYFFIYKPLNYSIDAENHFIALILLFLYLVIFGYVSRVINLSTIYVSAMSLSERQVSFKNLYLRVKRSFQGGSSFPRYRRSTETIWFFIFIITITTVLILTLHYGVPNLEFIILALIVITVSTIVYLMYTTYKSVARVLAYVILVIEENCDTDEALTKAEWLVKGVKADAFVLNITAHLFILILFSVYIIIAAKRPSNTLVAGIFLLCVAYLQFMFLTITYTYLYFKCKESHGEEITFGDNAANTPLLDESVP